MKKMIVLSLLLVSSQVEAKTVVVTLNDGEQAAIVQLLDAAVHAQGLTLAPNAIAILNKIQTSPEFVSKKDDQPSQPPDVKEDPK